jgi:beta-mannosidase
MKKFRRKAGGLSACLFCIAPLLGGQTPAWNVRLEEPTGIYRRTNEIVSIPVGESSGFTVLDPGGNEVPWQHAGDRLMFPASVIPGELPLYVVSCCGAKASQFPNPIVARKIGLHRLELANAQFRIVIDTDIPAIIEAYNLSAEEHHRLNLVDRTPERPGALKNDIHDSSARRQRIRGVEGENEGWTSQGGSGPVKKVEFLETGPLRARVRLLRTSGSWEFEWTADSRSVVWTAHDGFRFLSVSAAPYLPFNRCVGGDEHVWPLGPERIEPPDHDIEQRQWKKLPGGNMVYYNHEENYGALGIVALDEALDWTGAGSRRFVAQNAGGETRIALTFPPWDGFRTELNARRENALLRHPLLVQVETRQGPPPPLAHAYPRAAAFPTTEAKGRPAPFAPRSLSLDGDWQLAYSDRGSSQLSDARSVKVPGSVHTEWYPGDRFSVPPPKYYTHAADWISYKDWWYRKSFRIPRNFSGKRLRLQFDATDYYADAYLNGKLLGRHEGYIDPYEYDVTGAVRWNAENELSVRIWTPVSYYWSHRPYYIKGSYGAVDQKPDDITAEGITRSVRLVASEGATIQDAGIDTRLLDNEGTKAEVVVDLKTTGDAEGARWELTLSPRSFSAPESYRVTAPATASQLSISVDHPRLWWTWDHGTPNLYNLDIRLRDANGRVLDGRTIAVGIREIEKKGWQFYLNRKRMFIRGTNYYYNLFLSQMTRADYEKDVGLMQAMNVNMIRLHTHFTNPEFYDTADERGILVWQDYLEAWYPHDRDFALRAARLYDPLIRYTRNHASVAIWATSDEEDLENYLVLTKHLAPRASLLDPQHRPVVRSTGRYGDSHVYHGWYGGSIWEYTSMKEQFVSELGATALPNYDSIIKFLPHGWPIKDHEEEWIFHKLQIPEAMHAWGEPDGMTLKEYIPQTQAYAARLFQIALERSRRLKYQPAGGILHFHAIDIWPSATMAAVDFYRQPTEAFYTVQRSFSPVLASLEYDRDRWHPGEQMRCGVWAVNDEWYGIPGAQIRWAITDSHGSIMKQGEFPAAMEADSSRKLGDVDWTAEAAGRYELRAQVINAAGKPLSENLFEFEIQ